MYHTCILTPQTVPPSTGTWSRLARMGEWLLLAVLAAYMVGSSLPRAWRTLNTDFPNYYVTARMLHEGVDTSRAYEWMWIERQKDHREVDQRVVGLVPITPFSTLAVYPLAALPALAAKRCWIVVNLGLLLIAMGLLQSLTGLTWRRIGIVVLLSYPLTINFAYGQYYVLLLLLLTLACWCYVRERRFLSGVFVGLAAGLKVFPVLYLLYFARKRDWKAFAGGIAGGAGAAMVSVLAFGWQMNRTYLLQVLPSTLRGEALDPYNLKAASLSSLLHHLLIYEAQLNPHPLVNRPWMFAVLLPLLQMGLLLAPALLLVRWNEDRPEQVKLEWAAIVLASLAMSTSPGDYLFTLLILPVCLMLQALVQERSYVWAGGLVVFYAIAGHWSGLAVGREGWLALLRVPRLYALILLCVFGYALLWRRRERGDGERLDRVIWAGGLAALIAVSIASNLRHQRGVYESYAWRVPVAEPLLMTAGPVVQGDEIHFVALGRNGYQHALLDKAGGVQLSVPSPDDILGVAASASGLWDERSGHESTLIPASGAESIAQAETPVASPDGRWLGYLREDHGRGRVWVRDLTQPVQVDTAVTSPELNVLEMSFTPGGGLIFAAGSGGRPGLFAWDRIAGTRTLGIEGARYPAVSPDGHWLAYSGLAGGSWNLWLRDLQNGQTRRVTDADCNDMQPAWEADSKTVVYASDCGRGLWLTALSKRQIVR
jgi:hypothetical protein